jgi:malate dehydrogenase (oxaloacetate-decarboxylating)(NADP+)
MVRRGEADAMLAGLVGSYHRQLRYVEELIGPRPGVRNMAAMNALILPRGTLFICDTYVHADPSAHQIAEMAVMAADVVRRFGVKPKIALVSHSNFGGSDNPSAVKMREALQLIQDRDPSLQVEGEMQADAAISPVIRERLFPNAQFKEPANLLIMPNLDAANIAFNLVKTLADGVSVGPILLGSSKPAHILPPSTTVRGIVNMSALAVVEAAMAGGDAADSDKQA